MCISTAELQARQQFTQPLTANVVFLLRLEIKAKIIQGVNIAGYEEYPLNPQHHS